MDSVDNSSTTVVRSTTTVVVVFSVSEYREIDVGVKSCLPEKG
jgi:hypothetical protein